MVQLLQQYMQHLTKIFNKKILQAVITLLKMLLFTNLQLLNSSFASTIWSLFISYELL